jgi:hypothetical protein
VLLAVHYHSGAFSGFFIIWIGLAMSTMICVATHFHFKQWGPEITEELNRMNFRLINERPLTIFEAAQFMDTRYFVEVISFNFKRIVEVECEQGLKTLCIRINKNYWSDAVKVYVLGEC